jgi:hypothetical protein
MAIVAATTPPKDQDFRRSELLANMVPYSVREAAMEAAQYMQNSPGNLVCKLIARAMLVPARSDETAKNNIRYCVRSS